MRRGGWSYGHEPTDSLNRPLLGTGRNVRIPNPAALLWLRHGFGQRASLATLLVAILPRDEGLGHRVQRELLAVTLEPLEGLLGHRPGEPILPVADHPFHAGESGVQDQRDDQARSKRGGQDRRIRREDVLQQRLYQVGTIERVALGVLVEEREEVVDAGERHGREAIVGLVEHGDRQAAGEEGGGVAERGVQKPVLRRQARPRRLAAVATGGKPCLTCRVVLVDAAGPRRAFGCLVITCWPRIPDYGVGDSPRELRKRLATHLTLPADRAHAPMWASPAHCLPALPPMPID